MQTLFLFGPVLLTLTLTTLVCACQQPAANPSTGSVTPGNSNPYPTVAAIDFYTEQGLRLNFLEWSRHHPGSAGHRVYLLAQSYMPAQDIHIVQNLRDGRLSPWYTVDTTSSLIETPEWTFITNPLRSWPAK